MYRTWQHAFRLQYVYIQASYNYIPCVCAIYNALTSIKSYIFDRHSLIKIHPVYYYIVMTVCQLQCVLFLYMYNVM